MPTSFTQTKVLASVVIDAPPVEARQRLSEISRLLKTTEPEFVGGLIAHSRELNLDSAQWFDLLSKLRFRTLRDDLRIMSKLSENQKAILPPPLFEK